MICTNKCHACPNIVYVNTPTITNDNLEITIPNEVIQNNEKLCFVITGSIPVSEKPLPIKILVNGEQFSYVSKFGNYVYSDQLTNRRLYVGTFKTDSLLLVNSKCNLGITRAIMPIISIPTVAPTQTVKVGDKK